MYLKGQGVSVQVCESKEEADSLKSKKTDMFFSTYEDYWLVPKKFSNLVESCGHKKV